jgi:hypothetical protein
MNRQFAIGFSIALVLGIVGGSLLTHYTQATTTMPPSGRGWGRGMQRGQLQRVSLTNQDTPAQTPAANGPGPGGRGGNGWGRGRGSGGCGLGGGQACGAGVGRGGSCSGGGENCGAGRQQTFTTGGRRAACNSGGCGQGTGQARGTVAGRGRSCSEGSCGTGGQQACSGGGSRSGCRDGNCGHTDTKVVEAGRRVEQSGQPHCPFDGPQAGQRTQLAEQGFAGGEGRGWGRGRGRWAALQSNDVEDEEPSGPSTDDSIDAGERSPWWSEDTADDPSHEE